MKKAVFITLALLFSVASVDANAQNFLKKIGKAVEKSVEKAVDKTVNQLGGKHAQPAKQSKPQQQEPQVKSQQAHAEPPATQTQSQQTQPAKVKGVVPTVVAATSADIPMSGSLNGHEWVDLGLPSGTRWATCNVDATQPSQPGKLYAWGEIATKASYVAENSKHYKKEVKDFSGNKANDVAAAKWGNGWRMPTKVEFDELLFYCHWNYVQKDGRWGAEITSTFNNKSIFLPVTGYKDGAKLFDASGNGMYWTSTPHEDQRNNGAHMYQFGGALGEVSVGERSSGFAIRAVLDNDAMINTPSQGETNGHPWVDLGLPSGTKWATCNIGAATSEHHGEYFAWAEITPITDKTSPKNNTSGKWMSGIAGGAKYDAAAALWGEGWEMPTKRDFQELLENCTFEWTSLGRIKGCKIISKINGNYIFMPAAGRIFKNHSYDFPDKLNGPTSYWASTPSKDPHNIVADGFLIYEKLIDVTVPDRWQGCPIRPVTK